MAKKRKQEALNVTRIINELLIGQLKIPLHQIVNDKTFVKYTFLQRPDLLISNVPYDISKDNEEEFIENLIAYCEVKDNCAVGDKDWIDAFQQGAKKAEQLKIPYFLVSNCNITYFYNTKTKKELFLNDQPIREFQNLDILNKILITLQKNENLNKIYTNVDLQSKITETIFSKKLWELANIYRQIDFKNVTEKIDFTIGFISLKFIEEKEIENGNLNKSFVHWTSIKEQKNLSIFIGALKQYIDELEKDAEFLDFKNLMEVVRRKIEKIESKNVREIFDVIESMNKLHGCGFDLFGAVYEMFASNKEKGDFGEYFTRRHYTHVFSKILLKNEIVSNPNKKFKILDPACGTGGFLTEAFKILKNNYEISDTLTSEAINFLRKEALYGIDVRSENVSRTKLNMFLVGDGHTNIEKENTLLVTKNEDIIDRLHWTKFDYILTNPPYGSGNIKAETNAITTTRFEIAFVSKIINILNIGGTACIIVPDGIFENPSYGLFRKELLERVNIDSIVSLPKFAFAPYTKEKTYALFITKRSDKLTKIQDKDIWMYIIDNDGYANSDKRFPTKLKNEDGSWRHDEISAWVNTKTGKEELGLLEQRWNKFDDSFTDGTSWINEAGEKVKKRKGGFIKILDISESNYFNLLPEYHIRKESLDYITIEDFDTELINIQNELRDLIRSNINEN